MRRYVVRRLIALPLIVVAVSIITFCVLRLPIAGDPAVLLAGQGAPPATVAPIRHPYGLDRPLVVHFGDWVAHLACGDFGPTFRGRQPVWHEVVHRMPVTFEVVGLTLLFGTFFGVLFGVVTAVRYRSPLDYGVRLFAVLG